MPKFIEVNCPRCQTAFAVHENQLATRTTCPNCLEEFSLELKPASTTRPSTETNSTSKQNPDLNRADDSDPIRDEHHGVDEHSPAAIRLDDRGSTTSLPGPELPYDFTAHCPLCGTRQDVNSKQIGTKLRCPDCHSSFTVQEPHRSARRVSVESTTAPDDDLQLSQPVTSILRSQLSHDWIGAANDELAQEKTSKPRTLSPQDVIQQTLRNAADEIDRLTEEEPEFPRYPFQTGILRFLSSPIMISRWLMTALALEIELAAMEMAIQSAKSGGFEQVFALLFGIFATVFGFLFFCFLSTSFLLVTQHSSQGRDRITGWPGINVMEWAFEAWPMIAALFLTFAPGILLGQLIAALSTDTTSIAWLGAGIGVISMTLFFPVILLSLMENSWPYSKPIWRSVRVSQPVWLSFWLHSGIVVLFLGVFVSWRLKSGSGIGGYLLDVGILFALLVYFWLLGRLSWACDEALVRLEAES